MQLGLTVFGLFMVFDPLGSVSYGDMQDTPNQVRHHRKVTGLWSRRFRWVFCWLKRDEHGKEAFQQVAGEYIERMHLIIFVTTLYLVNYDLLRDVSTLVLPKVCKVNFINKTINLI